MSELSWIARGVGVLALALLMLAGAWPSVTGTIGFGVAGLTALCLFIFLAEDDIRRQP